MLNYTVTLHLKTAAQQNILLKIIIYIIYLKWLLHTVSYIMII